MMLGFLSNAILVNEDSKLTNSYSTTNKEYSEEALSVRVEEMTSGLEEKMKIKPTDKEMAKLILLMNDLQETLQNNEELCNFDLPQVYCCCLSGIN